MNIMDEYAYGICFFRKGIENGMKRIIFFAKHMDLGGLEKSLLTLLNHLDHTQYHVTLVLEERRGVLLRQLDRRVEVRQYRLSACPIRPVRRALNLLKRLLWSVKNRNAYDFSCAYCTYSVIGSYLAQIASENSCLYVHNDYSRILPDEADFRAFFDSLRTPRFRSVVFVSNESRDAFRARYALEAERLHVINNLIDGDAVRALASEPCSVPPAPELKTFLFVGRLDETQKRLSRLLEGMHLAAQQRQDLRLLIVGDGPDRAACEQLSQRLGLSGCVLFLGAQENPYPFFSAADCLVLTSDYEGFPVVYYEAMALGLDILTTVPVSDEQVNIAERAIIAAPNASAVGAAMAAYQPQRHPPFDFAEANDRRCRMLAALMERG